VKQINRNLQPIFDKIINEIFKEMLINDEETYEKLVVRILEMDEAKLKEDIKKIIDNQL
jgi:molybdopterin-biosynthesis enzyme MoeA-like protein